MGTPAACSEAEFIALFKQHQSATTVAKILGKSPRAVQKRRKTLESRGVFLPTLDHRTVYNKPVVEHNHGVIRYDISDGQILVGSDAHIWPGPLSTMQRAFLQFARTLKPAAVVANGDFFDGARNSRHPSIGWEHKPEVHEELAALQNYMGEIKKVSPKSRRMWPLGNHDARYENKLAAQVGEYKNIKGVHLKDHFDEDWIPCWRIDVNRGGDYAVIRHRELGGEHADYRNVVNGGAHIVTGHDHRTGVVPYRNYAGLRYGVRCGFMGDSPLDPQFVNYLEAKEPNWHPAFVVLTFLGGRLLMPELVTKWDDKHVQFRGEIIAV
jgi:hypothetical protein